MFGRKQRLIEWQQMELNATRQRVDELAAWKGRIWRRTMTELDAIVGENPPKSTMVAVPAFIFDLYDEGLGLVVRYQDIKVAQAGYPNLMFRGTPIVRCDLLTAP